MLNLLPEDMRGFHRKRVLNSAAFVWGVASVLLLIIGLLTLIPAYSFTMIRVAKDPEQVKTEQKTHELAEEMQVELEDDAVVAQYVQKFTKSKTFSDVYSALDAVLILHPAIRIDDITFARGEASNTLAIRGRTETREHLVSFVRAMESVPLFESVVLPIGDLAGREGVFVFTVTIQIPL